jgi:ketosteroid isomerase-like protein
MSALTNDQKLAVAARFAAATRGNDPEASAALNAPGSVTWHNFDELEVTPEHGARTMTWLRRAVPDLAWIDVATLPTPNGFVMQTILTGTAPGGPLRLHSCMVVSLDDAGLITRIEEYLDTAQSAVLRG